VKQVLLLGQVIQVKLLCHDFVKNPSVRTNRLALYVKTKVTLLLFNEMWSFKIPRNYTATGKRKTALLSSQLFGT